MLNLVGDILNWIAAGFLFPLMLLPLAVAIAGKREPQTLIWAILVALAAGAGALFCHLAPVLHATLTLRQGVVFFVMLTGAGAFVYASGGPAKTIAQAAPVLERITSGAGRLVMWLVLVMAFVQFAVVILRYVFGVNFIFMQESVTYMHGAVFLLAGGYALVTNDHVRVDIFYRDAPEKRKALVDFLGAYFLLFPICFLLLWTASPYVASSWAAGEGSTETSGIQGVFLLKSLVPAFAVLLAFAGFVIAARAGETLRRDG